MLPRFHFSIVYIAKNISNIRAGHGIRTRDIQLGKRNSGAFARYGSIRNPRNIAVWRHGTVHVVTPRPLEECAQWCAPPEGAHFNRTACQSRRGWEAAPQDRGPAPKHTEAAQISGAIMASPRSPAMHARCTSASAALPGQRRFPRHRVHRRPPSSRERRGWDGDRAPREACA